MDKKLIVSPSPHVHSGHSASRLMLDVLIALIPAFAMSVWVYGTDVLVVTGVSVAACVAVEYLIQRFMVKGPCTICNYSAILTGVLLAFNLPSSIPLWMVVIGAIVAIGVGKMPFGGLGANPFNPALVGRVFMLLSFPVAMTSFPEIAHSVSAVADMASGAIPMDSVVSVVVEAASGATPVDGATAATVVEAVSGATSVDVAAGATAVDAFSGATPLAAAKAAVKQGIPVSEVMSRYTIHDLLLGFRSGSFGEISALGLLIGFVWLLFRRVITWHIPVFVLGSMAIFSGILFAINPTIYMSPVYHILTGGALLGAIFMATDYVTSPMIPRGQIIFAVGIGVITILIRVWGAYPEGMSFAILVMNAFVPLINKYVKPRSFGLAK